MHAMKEIHGVFDESSSRLIGWLDLSWSDSTLKPDTQEMLYQDHQQQQQLQQQQVEEQ